MDVAGAPQGGGAVERRRRVHEHRELGNELPQTQATVLEALDGLPLEITTGDGLSSIVAVLDGDEPGPTLLMRGDMDALPMPYDTGLDFASRIDGTTHACGHAATTALLAGADHPTTTRLSRTDRRPAFLFHPGTAGTPGATSLPYQ